MSRRDKYRSSSRSPTRHYERRQYRDESEASGSGGDDDYERRERRRTEKEPRRREREAGYSRERGSYGGSYGEARQEHGSRGIEYEGSGHDSGEYRQPPPTSAYGSGTYGGESQYSAPSSGYGQQPSYESQGGYEGTRAGYGQPEPPAQYQYNAPPPPGPPPSGIYSHPPPPPSGSYGYQPPPPGSSPAFAPGYQNQYQPPPPGQQPPSHGYEKYQSEGVPLSGAQSSTYGSHSSIGYSSRPQYSASGGNSGHYKPQHHSSAQESETAAGASTYFSGETGVVAEPKPGGSVLDTFTKGMNTALHGYARTLFPATSSYKADGSAPEARTGNRFESFAHVRNGNGIKWYVDGKDYMYAVSLALEKARESIWILDWWLTPELYLRRPPKYNEQYRLDRMLQAAAARGVRINVIVYKEVTQALTLDSAHTKHALEGLHKNICVFRHPDHLPDRDNVIRDTWTKLKSGEYKLGDGLKGVYGMRDDITLYFAHHEKLCLIDGEIAFMGGLDLCFGRWDTNEHPIADAHPSDLNSIVYPGQDYNNARFMDFQHVDKWEDNAVSRLELSRMGWSDVALSLIGPTVEDLKLHFIQRWNFIYDDKYDARAQERYARLDDSMYKGGHGYHRRHLKNKVKNVARGYDDEDYGSADGRDYDNQPGPEGVRCQICRSISKWSHGTPETEHSIANAYIEIISAARHFVYIENQFFITGTDPKQKPILNMIGRAIVDRIIRAAREGERFRVVVIMPAVPAFAGDLQDESALGTRAIMEFQYRSINRDRGYSIMEQIESAGINPKEYIRFYNLRNYDRINFAGAELGKEKSGVDYESAARAHDEQVGGGIGYGAYPGGQQEGYGARIRGDEYDRYQYNAPKTGGQWDSVAKCVMLDGGDIRNIPWEGDPDKEIEAFVSEELYVHSKLLIADDRICIIGSANLNDRSQLGDHDSEIACIIEDPTPLPSRMNSRPYTASHFAATLRRQIIRKHLGLIPAQDLSTVDENMQPIPVPNIYDFDSPEDRLVEDPLSDEFWGFWNETARINTEVFAKVFHAVPHDSVTNWKKYDEYWGKHFGVPKKDKKGAEKEGPKAVEKWGHVVRSEFPPGAEGAREIKGILSAVRGTLVEMPLEFLKEEDIAQEGLGLNAFTETLYT